MKKQNEAVLLFDLSSIAHPIWHVSQKEPDPDYVSQRTAEIVRQLAANHPYAAICCDSRKSFRKELDPTYKAQRAPADAALYHQIDLAVEALEADGFPVWKVDGFEADDLIASAAALLAQADKPEDHVPVLIASADKDLLALVCDTVEVHSLRTGKRVGPAEVKEKFGVEPWQMVDYLTMVGDTSDNIKGAQGIGPKQAVGLLEIYGTLDDVYSAIDQGEGLDLKPAQRRSLGELRPRLEAVRGLVTMRTDVPLDINAVFQIRVPKVAGVFLKGGEMNQEEFEEEVIVAEAPGPPELAPTEPKPESVPAVTAETAPPWEQGLEPRSMNDAVRLAKWMFDSRMFSSYGTPQAVLSTVLLGRELGLPAMAALRSVHIIEGRHSLSAELMVALVLKSGMAEYFRLVETTDKICTYETKRKGNAKPLELSYTIEQAFQAGLLKKPRAGKQEGPWHKIPKQMLRARCKSELARLEYPDLLAGLYTPEELRDANA